MRWEQWNRLAAPEGDNAMSGLAGFISQPPFSTRSPKELFLPLYLRAGMTR
jgi:hypothetical protein